MKKRVVFKNEINIFVCELYNEIKTFGFYNVHTHRHFTKEIIYFQKDRKEISYY